LNGGALQESTLNHDTLTFTLTDDPHLAARLLQCAPDARIERTAARPLISVRDIPASNPGQCPDILTTVVLLLFLELFNNVFSIP
jgi:hypothetical protein